MARLGENRYGKSRVRLSRITRHGDRHSFDEWNVRVLLTGDFGASFTHADNSSVLPTDTMKNTVYSIACDSKAVTIEDYAKELGDYLLANHTHVSSVSVEVSSRAWQPMMVEDKSEPTTFQLGGPQLDTVEAVRDRDQAWDISSGVDGLTILKTTKSGFTGYIRDRLTTLRPATDRIFGTCATVRWDLPPETANFAGIRSRVVAQLLKSFAAHDSMSVQHTLYDMGCDALKAAPEILRIHLTMPNLHHLLADLSAFGQDNPNHIFVPVDEPHGYIEATVER